MVTPAGMVIPAKPVRFVPPVTAEKTASAITVNANAPKTAVAFVSEITTDVCGDILAADFSSNEGRALVYSEGVGVGYVGAVDRNVTVDGSGNDSYEFDEAGDSGRVICLRERVKSGEGIS